MSRASSRPSGSRGRPRDPDRDRRILAAALELLGRTDYRTLSVDAIAARAGVAKTTVYRRWPRKVDLVLDAVGHNATPAESVDSADPLEDLRRLLDTVYRELADTSAGPAWPLIAARLLADEEIAEQYRARFIAPRYRRAKDLLARAVRAGQLPAGSDLDLIAAAVAAPATFYPLVLGVPAPMNAGRDLLDLIIARAG